MSNLDAKKITLSVIQSLHEIKITLKEDQTCHQVIIQERLLTDLISQWHESKPFFATIETAWSAIDDQLKVIIQPFGTHDFWS